MFYRTITQLDGEVTHMKRQVPLSEQKKLARAFRALTQIAIESNGTRVPLLRVFTAFRGIGEPLSLEKVALMTGLGHQLIVEITIVPKLGLPSFGYFFTAGGLSRDYYSMQMEPWPEGIKATRQRLKERMEAKDYRLLDAILPESKSSI